jgi:prepilin-type N-terminal cleavage/methylation domain-containing protein
LIHLQKRTDRVTNMLRKNSGFSLAELMVVIAIIALICAIALPATTSWLSKQRKGNAAREMLGFLELARLTAVRRGRPVIVQLDYAAETYRAMLDTDRNGTGDELVRAGSMPPGIDLMQPASSSLGTAFRFNNLGMPVKIGSDQLHDGSVLISNGRQPDKKIRMNAGGNIRIE